MLTVADRREEGKRFAKIVLTSYVNAPLEDGEHNGDVYFLHNSNFRRPLMIINAYVHVTKS